jgi:hypothetical protein
MPPVYASDEFSVVLPYEVNLLREVIESLPLVSQ